MCTRLIRGVIAASSLTLLVLAFPRPAEAYVDSASIPAFDPSSVSGFIPLCLSLLIVIPWWFIFRKAGYSKWLSLMMILPGANFVILIWFASVEWPVLKGIGRAGLDSLNMPEAQRGRPPNRVEAAQ